LDGHFRLIEGRSARAVEQRRRIENAFERAREATKRGEAITGMDTVERKKIAKELMWRAKWDIRGAKFDARARKYA